MAFAFERQWELSSLPEGTYTARVEAIDHDRNVGFDEVTIYVGTEAPETGGESEGDAGGDSSGDGGDASEVGTGGDDGGDDGSGGGSGPDTDGDSAGGGGADDGAGCRTAPTENLGWASLLLLGMCLVRRRR